MSGVDIAAIRKLTTSDGWSKDYRIMSGDVRAALPALLDELEAARAAVSATKRRRDVGRERAGTQPGSLEDRRLYLLEHAAARDEHAALEALDALVSR